MLARFVLEHFYSCAWEFISKQPDQWCFFQSTERFLSFSGSTFITSLTAIITAEVEWGTCLLFNFSIWWLFWVGLKECLFACASILCFLLFNLLWFHLLFETALPFRGEINETHILTFGWLFFLSFFCLLVFLTVGMYASYMHQCAWNKLIMHIMV